MRKPRIFVGPVLAVSGVAVMFVVIVASRRLEAEGVELVAPGDGRTASWFFGPLVSAVFGAMILMIYGGYKTIVDVIARRRSALAGDSVQFDCTNCLTVEEHDAMLQETAARRATKYCRITTDPTPTNPAARHG